jgi:O-6-methylguanine DNA methyltransferase
MSRPAVVIQIHSENRDGVWFAIAVNEKNELVACNFSNESRFKAEKSVQESIPKELIAKGDSNTTDYPSIVNSVYQAYLGNGTRMNKVDFLENVSGFRKKVYAQLNRIPRGRVTTYGAIAKKLGSKRYSRAVGTAVATNPISLIIPCHRVLPSSLKVGNYGMPGRKPTEGGPIKRALLEREGVKFIEDKVVEECLWSPD